MLGVIYMMWGALWIALAGYEIEYLDMFGFAGLVSGIFSLLCGLLILIGYHELNAKCLWAAFYILIIDIIWLICVGVTAIVVYELLFSGILALVNAVFILIFLPVLRSYAFEILEKPHETPATV